MCKHTHCELCNTFVNLILISLLVNKLINFELHTVGFWLHNPKALLFQFCVNVKKIKK